MMRVVLLCIVLTLGHVQWKPFSEAQDYEDYGVDYGAGYDDYENDDLDYFDDLYDDLYSDVIDEEEPFESEPEEQTRPEEPSEPIEELSEPEAFEPQPSQPEKLTESEKPTEPNLSGAKELTESEYSSKPEEPTELEESTESNQHVEPRNPDESVESTGSREPSEPEPTDSYLQTLEEECVDHKPETCELAEDKLWAPNVCELVIIAQQFESLCPNPPTPCVTSDRVISAIFGENVNVTRMEVEKALYNFKGNPECKLERLYVLKMLCYIVKCHQSSEFEFYEKDKLHAEMGICHHCCGREKHQFCCQYKPLDGCPEPAICKT